MHRGAQGSEVIERRASINRPDRRRDVVLANPGNGPHVRQTALALFEAGMLGRIETTIVYHPGWWAAKALRALVDTLPPQVALDLERRRFDEVPWGYFRTYPFWEVLRTGIARSRRRTVLKDAIWERGEQAFARQVAQRLAPPARAVYAYEHAALEILRAARRQGMAAFYDQPSQHHAAFAAVLERITHTCPNLLDGATLRVHSSDRSRRRNARRDAELELADWVMCNSSFTRRTLVDAGVPPGKIVVTPLGFPEVKAARKEAGGPVVFLNAGTQSVWKGIHLLLRAWARIAPAPEAAELWLIGNDELPDRLYQDLPGRVVRRSRLPHSELMALYRAAHVFVLPSYGEGFGMVISEAMSRGVPVITTPNTAGADFIRHGVNGWLIPAGDAAALEAQMRDCIDRPEGIRSIGERAAVTARQWQWADYRRDIARKVFERIEEHGRWRSGLGAPPAAGASGDACASW